MNKKVKEIIVEEISFNDLPHAMQDELVNISAKFMKKSGAAVEDIVDLMVATMKIYIKYEN